MRFSSLALVAALMLTGIGCQHNLAKNGDCQSCGGPHSGGGAGLFAGHGHGGGGGHGNGGGHGGTIGSHLGGPAPTPVGRLPHGYANDAGPSGPPSATVGYPFYTTRSPRDFLMASPPTIGP